MTWWRRVVAMSVAVACLCGVASASSSMTSTRSRVALVGHLGFVSPSGVAGLLAGCLVPHFGSEPCTGILTRFLARRQRLPVTVEVEEPDDPDDTGNVTRGPHLRDSNRYALVTSPRTVAGSTFTNFNLALTNASSPGLKLGSARFKAPPGFKVLEASLPRRARGHVSVAGDVVLLRRLGLRSSATLHVRVTAVAPARCKVYSSNWASAAWEGGNFNVRALIRDNARSTLKTTVKGPCRLRFVTEPTASAAAQRITGAAGDPSGTPVAVEVLDSKGKVVTSSTARVTIGMGDNPTGATLGGTRTVRAVHGVARFTDLSLSKPGSGYRLRASSPRLPRATSSPFDVSATVAPCAQNQVCQTKLSTTESSFAIVARADPGAPNAGALSESVDVGEPLQCSGYTQEDSHSWDFSMSSANRSKIITYTLKVPAIPLSGTLEAILNETQACFGSLAEFTTKSGLPAAARAMPDGSIGFIGLLPDCPIPNGPCVVSRQSILDLSSPIGFDIVLVLYVPEGLAGDPRMRV